MIGHTFWCERTRTGLGDIACTCADPPSTIRCRCGHGESEHIGHGAGGPTFCRWCRSHINPGWLCNNYAPVLIPG